MREWIDRLIAWPVVIVACVVFQAILLVLDALDWLVGFCDRWLERRNAMR